MEPDNREGIDGLDAQETEELEATRTVQANEAMDDAFYGNQAQNERDMLNAAEVNRNQS